MLKFIKQHAESITGVGIYPVISLVIFFLFFVGLLYYVRKMDKDKADAISRMPLQDNPEREETDHTDGNHLKHA
ncbi:MAG TPA: cbb3-type cytochrome c oxidase subunit 3 [Chitinophagaceae bacterium]|nr:cbb3-type cytochrome c oxidase subunit 3 [Chitinophagaceae bacterium]